MRCSNAWKLWNKFTKGENLLKTTNTAKIPIALDIVWTTREEELPYHPTPIRAALASERGIMYSVQAMCTPGVKHTCCTSPYILQNNVKSLWNTKNTGQRPHMEASDRGRDNREKNVKFKSSTKDMNNINHKAVSNVLFKNKIQKKPRPCNLILISVMLRIWNQLPKYRRGIQWPVKWFQSTPQLT